MNFESRIDFFSAFQIFPFLVVKYIFIFLFYFLPVPLFIRMRRLVMLLYRLLLVSSFVLTILGAKIGRGEIDDEGDTETDQEIEDEDNNFNLGDLKSPPV